MVGLVELLHGNHPGDVELFLGTSNQEAREISIGAKKLTCSAGNAFQLFHGMTHGMTHGGRNMPRWCIPLRCRMARICAP